MQLFSRHLPDASLIEGIREGGPQRRLCENRLYEKYDYLIADGSRKHRLPTEDSASAYSDAVLSVIENLTTGRFEGRSELKTYLFQIFTNKCVDLIRKNTTNRQRVHDTLAYDDALLQHPDETRPIIDQLIAQYDIGQLRQQMQVLGNKCQEIILAWGDGYSDDEIAKTMSYNSAAVVKTTRLRCLEKLRELYRHMTP